VAGEIVQLGGRGDERLGDLVLFWRDRRDVRVHGHQAERRIVHAADPRQLDDVLGSPQIGRVDAQLIQASLRPDDGRHRAREPVGGPREPRRHLRWDVPFLGDDDGAVAAPPEHGHQQGAIARQLEPRHVVREGGGVGGSPQATSPAQLRTRRGGVLG
jgi:hypothetical protein